MKQEINNVEKYIHALRLSRVAHEGQKRKTGEDYITHPIEVSYIAEEHGADLDTKIACLLHDVVEDTPVKLKDIKKEFGKDVSYLVEGVTNFSRSKEKNMNKVETYSKKDKRVLLVKMADRLHNLSNPYEGFNALDKYEKSTLQLIKAGKRSGYESLADELEFVLGEYRKHNKNKNQGE